MASPEEFSRHELSIESVVDWLSSCFSRTSPSIDFGCSLELFSSNVLTSDHSFFMTLDNQGVIKIKVSLTSVAEEEDRLRARVLCQQVATAVTLTAGRELEKAKILTEAARVIEDHFVEFCSKCRSSGWNLSRLYLKDSEHRSEVREVVLEKWKEH